MMNLLSNSDRLRFDLIKEWDLGDYFQKLRHGLSQFVPERIIISYVDFNIYNVNMACNSKAFLELTSLVNDFPVSDAIILFQLAKIKADDNKPILNIEFNTTAYLRQTMIFEDNNTVITFMKVILTLRKFLTKQAHETSQKVNYNNIDPVDISNAELIRNHIKRLRYEITKHRADLTSPTNASDKSVKLTTVQTMTDSLDPQLINNHVVKHTVSKPKLSILSITDEKKNSQKSKQ